MTIYKQKDIMRTSIGPNNMSVLLILLAAIILASCNE